MPQAPGDHSSERLRAAVEKSARALAPHKIRVFYLHAPDRSVSYEETLRGVNELYKEGFFEEFGLSNFYSWEVAEFVGIAKANNWVRPTVYQGLYNALERNVETELFPCLRKYGIRFHGFSPLARGLFAGTNIASPSPGSRWDLNSSPMAPGLHARYQGFQSVFQRLRELLAKHSITGSEAALRWLQHHSLLTPDDAVIIGASSLTQLQANIKDSEAGPLPEEVVKLLEEAWIDNKGRAPPYFR
ncbi:Aldo/keto reductase [Leucogyrophana mollusca]|uniref:Aldo/keto reductase n=1 Tax=Leucogyrophana mollusca TaxID=85980 RepID=A0ACB8BEN5_9AGAM|nr:Aldo/keto reductase [Leucogyrophana mollusca]